MSYPYLVQIAWNAVEKFLKDWQAEPDRWWTEADIQAEVSGRLMAAYRAIGRDALQGNDKSIAGYQGGRVWNRVCSGPSISYEYKDGKIYKCRPDIVVWDDAGNSEALDPEGRRSWPMLWMCEIKISSMEKEIWDVEKMRYLLAKEQARYGCWLNMFRSHATRGNGIDWKKSVGEKRLWVCEVKLPTR